MKNKTISAVCAIVLLLFFIYTMKLWITAGLIIAVYAIIKHFITRSQDNGNHSNSYQPQDGFKPKETITVEAQESDSDL